MKTLYILRHAKSSWDFPGVKDHDRPLNERGLNNAPMMAERFKQRGEQLDMIIHSSARRAKDTAMLFAAGIGFPTENMVENKAIYDSSINTLLQIVQKADKKWQSIMLVGHNPEFTALVNLFAETPILNLVTCGLVRIELDIKNWSELSPAKAKVLYYDFPKKPA
jgi:phosphohistidine phosphatase